MSNVALVMLISMLAGGTIGIAIIVAARFLLPPVRQGWRRVFWAHHIDQRQDPTILPRSMPSRDEMEATKRALHRAAIKAQKCHDSRCPGVNMHPCHNLDCKQHYPRGR